MLFSFCSRRANTNANTNVSIDSSISRIQVLDFHLTNRCRTCNAIEANTIFTLETYFSQALKEGRIEFKSLNIEEPENKAMAEQFQAYGTSLFLNVMHKGVSQQINITDFAFMKVRDRSVFSEELKVKIDSLLKDL